MRPGAGLARLDPRPEGDGAVKDVPGQDLLEAEVEVRRVRELQGGQQGGDRAAVVAELHRHLALDEHRMLVPLVLDQAVGGQESGQRAVDAELLLDLGHVEADLPADRLRALRQDLAPPHEQGGGAALDAHGVITILSASRRS